MTPDRIIGIDAGTSVMKAVVFSVTGEQLASASRPNAYVRVPGGGVEQDMARTFADAAAVLKDLTERMPDLAGRVAAVSVTAQGDGTWLIDAEGEPVAPAWLWLDARAGAVAEAMAARPNFARQYEKTGTGINPCQQGAQLAFMMRQSPDVLARAATAFHCKDWLYFRLTDMRACDPSEATFTFGDFRTRGYDPAIVSALGLDTHARLLPPIVDGVSTAHPLTEAAAGLTGLKPGTPVVLGYVDVVCTALGGGLYGLDGDVGCSIIGSTGMHMRLARTPDDIRLNAENSGYTMAFPAPPACAQMQSNMAATLNIDWMLTLYAEVLAAQGVARDRAALMDGLDAALGRARPGAAIYHPYISEAGERGPFMDPSARAQFTGLDDGVGFFDMMRAVLEGLAFASRDCYAAMGPMPGRIRLTGGAARSRTMRTILSSVLGASISIVEREEAGAAGTAMIAAVQQGLYPDMAACCRDWVEPLVGPEIVPDAVLAATYDGLFPLYLKTRETMRPIWRSLADIRRQPA